jgi:hypothetical protein
MNELRRRATDHKPAPPQGDEPWRCSDDLLGARLEAADGLLGVVADVVVEEDSWAVTGLVVTTDGASMIVPLTDVARIDWPQRTLYLRTKL